LTEILQPLEFRSSFRALIREETDPVSDPIQERLEAIKYPAWQAECRAVMLETDPVKIKHKFIIAEAAIAKRSVELGSSELDLEERQAMNEEREAMELALAEILAKHPELDKRPK
jgi:hypothetical protein